MYKNRQRVPFPVKQGVAGHRYNTADMLTNVGGRSKSQASLMSNTDVETASFTLPDNSRATITSTMNTTPTGGRVGLLPFMIAFYQDSVLGTNLIPSGSGIDVTHYLLFPTIFIPQTGVSSAGTAPDGENITAITTLSNVSGSSQDIELIVQARVIKNINASKVKSSSASVP